jgi:hypothetical protein
MHDANQGVLGGEHGVFPDYARADWVMTSGFPMLDSRGALC